MIYALGSRAPSPHLASRKVTMLKNSKISSPGIQKETLALEFVKVLQIDF